MIWEVTHSDLLDPVVCAVFPPWVWVPASKCVGCRSGSHFGLVHLDAELPGLSILFQTLPVQENELVRSWWACIWVA